MRMLSNYNNNKMSKMKIALKLQNEEKMKVEYARKRYEQFQRNQNDENNLFNQEGFRSAQHVPSDIFRRMISEQMPSFDIDDDDDEDDELDPDQILNAFAIHSGSYHHQMIGHLDNSWKDLPIRTLKKKDVEILSKSEDKKSCSICMTDFVEGDVLRILPCFHEFHSECVDQWFLQQNEKGKDASCPLDRKKIKDIAHQHV